MKTINPIGFFTIFMSLNNKDMTKIKENWKPIPGYEGEYEASDLGRIKSLHRIVSHSIKGTQEVKERILVATPDAGGYPGVHLRDSVSATRIHRIVMLAFHGPSKLHVDHINGNPMDNRLSNLRYCTRYENVMFYHQKQKRKYAKYYGTRLNKSGTWTAATQMTKTGKRKTIYLGTFKTELEAHLRCKSYRDNQ